MSESDPNVWSGRALQEVFVEVAVAVLHQCIRSLIGAGLLRTIMDISARAISLADRPQRAIWVTSVRMRREDRSSISSHPLADLGRYSVSIWLRYRGLLIFSASVAVGVE